MAQSEIQAAHAILQPKPWPTQLCGRRGCSIGVGELVPVYAGGIRAGDMGTPQGPTGTTHQESHTYHLFVPKDWMHADGTASAAM